MFIASEPHTHALVAVEFHLQRLHARLVVGVGVVAVDLEGAECHGLDAFEGA
jgi:hypothetical protein